MSSRQSVLVVASALVLSLVGLAAVAADGDSVSVDLKTFKFKVPEEQAALFGYDDGQSRLFFYTFGTGEAVVKLPADGDYELVIKASCDPAQDERAKFKAALDGQPIGQETLLTADEEKEYKLTVKGAKAGEHKLTIEFTNDIYKEGEFDRNFYVHGVSLKKAP